MFPDKFVQKDAASPPTNLCEDCDEKKEDKLSVFANYDVGKTKNIWWTVLCSNDEAPTVEINNLIGQTGHLERMNVWTHIFAAALYLLYSIFRPITPFGTKDTVSSSLAAFSYASICATFAFSSVYHVYSPHQFWSGITRLGDYFGIYLGIAAGTLSDLAIVTENLKNVKWTAIADIWIAMALLVTFFSVRRYVLPLKETRLPYFRNKCSLGLARNTNVDLEHSSLRATAGVVMSFSWILVVPCAFDTLEIDCAWVFAGSRITGTIILVAGMVFDNALMFPDNWLEENNVLSLEKHPCVCYRPSDYCCGGWIMTSHAFWHIAALVGTVVTTCGTEYVIIHSEVLS